MRAAAHVAAKLRWGIPPTAPLTRHQHYNSRHFSSPTNIAWQRKMNASEEDGDSKLQKVSTDLIRDIDAALQKYIRKLDGRGGTRVRSWARSSVVFPATCEVNLTSFTP